MVKAIVVDNKDPLNMGRIKVTCPIAYGDSISPWCSPCIQFLGDNSSITKMPQIGDSLWILFENDDIARPIYLGGWYKPNECDMSNDIRIKCKNNACIISSGSNEVTISKEGIYLKGDVHIKGDLHLRGDFTRSDY